jgi:hypothetical protein
MPEGLYPTYNFNLDNALAGFAHDQTAALVIVHSDWTAHGMAPFAAFANGGE